MISDEGVVSLPLRLAVSMLVISLALPMCLQSLSDGRRELSRAAGVELAEELARLAEEVSSRPVGESRIIEFDGGRWMSGSSIKIAVGSMLGEADFRAVRCSDGAGWSRLIEVDLPPVIVGFCSFDFSPFLFDGSHMDVVITHCRHSFGEVVQAGFA